MECGLSGSQNQSISKSRSKKNVKCYHCGKKGDHKRECWHPKKMKKPKGKVLSHQKLRVVLQVPHIMVKFYTARQQQLLKAEEDSLMFNLWTQEQHDI